MYVSVRALDPSAGKSPGGGLFNHQNVYIDGDLSYEPPYGNEWYIIL